MTTLNALLEAVRHPSGIRAREAVARSSGPALRRTALILNTGGSLMGSDRVEGRSPFNNGDDGVPRIVGSGAEKIEYLDVVGKEDLARKLDESIVQWRSVDPAVPLLVPPRPHATDDPGAFLRSLIVRRSSRPDLASGSSASLYTPARYPSRCARPRAPRGSPRGPDSKGGIGQEDCASTSCFGASGGRCPYTRSIMTVPTWPMA